MHFDALTLAAVVAELSDVLAQGRVQQVVTPDEYSIGLEVYANRVRHYLLCSADPQASRLHLVSHKLRRGPEQHTPLLLLLRKYVRDASIVQIVQPWPFERIVHLHFEHAEHGATILIVEPMGRLANLALTTPQGRILECVRRVRAGEHGHRVMLPGKAYVPPPPLDKLPPLDDGSADYADRLGALVAQSGPLWRALVEGVSGVSPSQARELAWRAAGDQAAAALDVDVLALARALQELWSPVHSGAWQPGTWQTSNKTVGFSAYHAHGRAEFVPAASMSQALEAYYDAPDAGAGVDPYAALREATARLVTNAIRRLERQLAALAEDEPAPGEAEKLRTQAEWLLALSSQVLPGQAALEVDLGDERLHIPLEPRLSAVEQAEKMFGRAAKLERAARIIPERRSQVKTDLEFLDQLSTDLALAENQPEIAAVKEELQNAGLLSAQQRVRKADRVGKDAAHARRFTSPDGFDILVGRSARQNEVVTFKDAHPQDWWLHARGAPGSHVVIRNQGRPVADATLEMAAQLAAYYSKLRGERAAEVMIAERRFVSRASGGHTGQVRVRNATTLIVPARMPELASA